MLFNIENWRWAIEILIMTVGFYYTWNLFKGTRGAKVLAGLVILLVGLTLLSAFLKLVVLKELISSFSAFFFLALIVIFQPELRRILADLGTRHLLNTSQQQTQVIEEVVSSIEALQRERYGALIAFEREVVYQPGRDTGTELDAKVSSDLLTSIFYPRTPLHDGGAIIVRDRIITAAAIFPVTQAEGLERTLGLRHRAALGLSDETDAVVVILSEETGIISIAHEGELERPLTVDQLRARLSEILLDESTNEDVVSA